MGENPHRLHLAPAEKRGGGLGGGEGVERNRGIAPVVGGVHLQPDAGARLRQVLEPGVVVAEEEQHVIFGGDFIQKGAAEFVMVAEPDVQTAIAVARRLLHAPERVGAVVFRRVAVDHEDRDPGFGGVLLRPRHVLRAADEGAGAVAHLQ